MTSHLEPGGGGPCTSPWAAPAEREEAESRPPARPGNRSLPASPVLRYRRRDAFPSGLLLWTHSFSQVRVSCLPPCGLGELLNLSETGRAMPISRAVWEIKCVHGHEGGASDVSYLGSERWCSVL